MHNTIALLAYIVLVAPCVAQTRLAPSGEQVLRNIEATFSTIQDFTVTLDIAVDLERLKVPNMMATMYFKRPDKVAFESEGFALLPKEGIGFTPGGLTRKFEVESMVEEKGRFRLAVKMKDDRTKLRRAFLLVDPEHWTVLQITSPQFDGRQMKADFAYQKVSGYWLPSSLVVSFSSDSADHEPPDPFGPLHQRPSQMPRTGSITIHYSNYRINTGLRDDIFDQPIQEKGETPK